MMGRSVHNALLSCDKQEMEVGKGTPAQVMETKLLGVFSSFLSWPHACGLMWAFCIRTRIPPSHRSRGAHGRCSRRDIQPASPCAQPTFHGACDTF